MTSSNDLSLGLVIYIISSDVSLDHVEKQFLLNSFVLGSMPTRPQIRVKETKACLNGTSGV